MFNFLRYHGESTLPPGFIPIDSTANQLVDFCHPYLGRINILASGLYEAIKIHAIFAIIRGGFNM